MPDCKPMCTVSEKISFQRGRFIDEASSPATNDDRAPGRRMFEYRTARKQPSGNKLRRVVFKATERIGFDSRSTFR
jgi:hypothetical protein